jgi:hypothetical protein
VTASRQESCPEQQLLLLYLAKIVQFVLPVTWTYGASRGITLEQLVKWWSTGPSKLANFPRKVFSLFFLYIFLEKNARIDFGWFCEFNK